MVKDPHKNKFTELRLRAQRLTLRVGRNGWICPMTDVQKLVHELDTYQIELELQNEDLRNAQEELEQIPPPLYRPL